MLNKQKIENLVLEFHFLAYAYTLSSHRGRENNDNYLENVHTNWKYVVITFLKNSVDSSQL